MQSNFLPNLLQGVATSPYTSLLPGANAIRPTAAIGSALLQNPSATGQAFNAAANALPKLPTAPTPTPATSVTGYVAPPRLDYAAIQSQARASAENAVNPYYTKQLGDFLNQQSYAQQQRTLQHETDIKALQEGLSNTLQGNDIQKGRTAEDVAQNQADINQSADQFQTDTGTAADANRIAQARQIAQSGLTGGLGAQQQEATQTQRNTAEKRQEQQFQQHRQAQELFKTRTFEDLARSGELATKAEGKAEEQKLFDLNDYIKTQGMGGFAEQNKRGELESQRLQAVLSEQNNQAKLAYQRYLAGISNPAQLASAASIYGGAF